MPTAELYTGVLLALNIIITAISILLNIIDRTDRPTIKVEPLPEPGSRLRYRINGETFEDDPRQSPPEEPFDESLMGVVYDPPGGAQTQEERDHQLYVADQLARKLKFETLNNMR